VRSPEKADCLRSGKCGLGLKFHLAAGLSDFLSRKSNSRIQCGMLLTGYPMELAGIIFRPRDIVGAGEATEAVWVVTRTPFLRRLAALAAMLALALNLAALPLVQVQAGALDAFGQPICSEHASLPDQPNAPTDGITCQFCCTLSVAASAAAPVLPLPHAIEWKQPAVLIAALHLPSPSRHLLGPPRGPPRA